MLSVKCLPLGTIGANCYILYEGSDAIVIDPGEHGDIICDTAKQLNVNIKCVFLTHGHFDHIGAVGFIVDKYDCDVYINKKDAEFLNDTYLNLSDKFGKPIMYNSSYICVENEIIDFLGYDFEFISTPGHTPGSMCIKVGDIMFTGDTLFKCSIGRAFEPYGDTELEICSIKNKILTLGENIVCYPGHGEATSIYCEKHFNPYLV